ncbi:signal peptide peptidase SppA [Buchnera aphidicola]|uniref:signal peptide peptidase SppA n=1 Tax=Buchnera aphidicola TaxID=9 RepID=UPI0009E3860A|nr:signal peptide peptidase SppA [Buchnera aphidicola]
MKVFLKKMIKLFQCLYWIFNVLRKILLNILFLFLIMGIGLWIYSQKNNSAILYHPNYNSALIINLNEKIKEQELANQYIKNNLYNKLRFLYDENTKNSVFEIVQKIRQAKKDPKITGLILKMHSTFTSNQVILSYIGKALQEFKKSGKAIYAIGFQYTQSQYYLASFAKKIFLLPHGKIKLYGFSSKQLYFKKFLNTCKVHLHIFRIGKYKSAVEPFLRNQPSNLNKKINTHWMNAIWKNYLETVAKNRKTTKEDIFPKPRRIMHTLKKNKNTITKIALKNHLIDKIDTYININKYLIKIFGKNKNNKKFNSININNYFLKKKKITKLPNKIAIILANGTIDNNLNNAKGMNVSSIIAQMKYAKNDSNIRSIVLRINSPGGNANISELLRKKISIVRKINKPIVISMGNVAASGGYWIAMGGSFIIAHPITITGSIGIFSVLQTFEKTLSTLGIHNIGSEILPINNFYAYNNLTIKNKKIMKINLCKGYKKFVKLVAHSRHRSLQQINRIAQGRIWLGKNAKNIGLIDQLGDFDSAIIKAAKLAKLKKYEIVWIKTPNNFLTHLKYQLYFFIHQSFKNVVLICSPDMIQKIIFAPLNIMYSITKYFGNNKYSALCLNYKIKY